MGGSSPFSRSAPAKATEVVPRQCHVRRQTGRNPGAAPGRGADAVTQASSLGAEDVVITHLINALQLDIPIFVLETGALHTETLARARPSRAPIQVYRPEAAGVIHFIRTNGQDAMYRSIDLRKACCGIRKMEPLARALAGKSACAASDAKGAVPADPT